MPQPPDEQQPAPPTHRRRPRLTAGIAIAAVAALALGGLGAWLLVRDPDRDGAPDPVIAVREFLQAVYRDHDLAAAAATVCSQARDEAALAAKIDEIRGHARNHVDPRFTWNRPRTLDQTDDLTIVAVTVTMKTGDEKTSDQHLNVTVLDKDPHGWWVCDIATVPGETQAPLPDDEDPAGDEDPADDGDPAGDEDPADDGEAEV